jgi:hypothetical protein
MAKKIKYVTNAPLEKDDKVICVKMDDHFSPVKPGTPGKVTGIDNVKNKIIYRVTWLDGSKYGLIVTTPERESGDDTWKKIVEYDSDEELFENIILSTTKGKILKEIKRK